MHAERSRGRLLRAALIALVAVTALPLAAAEAPIEPSSPELPQLLQIAREAQAPYEVVASWRERIRWLDPAVFTDISPVTIPDVGIRLPADQEE